MKFSLHITLMLIYIGTSVLFSQDPDTLFNEANRAYAEGDYQHALDLYSMILENGIESGEVFFNLGNTYYKMNDIGRAILYYEKAKKYIDGDPALEQNLRLCQLRIVDKIEPIPKLFIVQWWSTVTQLFSINTFLWLCLAIFSMLIILIIINLIYPRRYLRHFIWGFTTIFILIFVVTFSRIYEFETTKFGVILEEKVSVFSEPDVGGTEVFILHEGTKVQINRTLNQWMEISIPDGKTGWLNKENLEII